MATLTSDVPRAVGRADRRSRLRTVGLVTPAVLIVLLFLLYPLVFIVQMSFTERDSFLSRTGPILTADNYVAMVGRYLPNVAVTLQLAALAMLVDLVVGFPFAYILVRKVRYRNLVRAFMVFPMFGALYIAFGMRFIFLPGGPASPILAPRSCTACRRSCSRWPSSPSRSWS
jgi:ABC-type sugar transport system permease subunit